MLCFSSSEGKMLIFHCEWFDVVVVVALLVLISIIFIIIIIIANQGYTAQS